jgi:hypothetical protein
MNQIPERQNQDQFLQYLAAQRQLYDDEKKWTAIWTLVVTCVAILGTGALAIFMPFTPHITWVTLIVVTGEFSFLPSILKRREEAAKIQELFDCELLELNWNDALDRDKPKRATILAAVEKFRKRKKPDEWEKLKNWYTPTVGNLPLHQARVACQKENIWWDAKQRREYARWVYLATSIFFFLLVTVGIIADWSFKQFFQGPMLLALPVLAMGVKHGYDHQKAADRLDELREYADNLWSDASQATSDPDAITQRSRELQNEIFHHRSENAPVFSWFYEKLRKKYERLAEEATVLTNDI